MDKKTAHKNGVRKEAASAVPLRQQSDSTLKSDQLVCRYCGSDDLAPSSSSGAIAGAASVSVNATGRRYRSGRRR
jgi:hypothetical protein